MAAATQPTFHVRGPAAAVGARKETSPATSATAAAAPRRAPTCWFYQCHRPRDTQQVKEEGRRRAEDYFAQLKTKPDVHLVRGETIEDDSGLQSRFLHRPMGQKLHDMLQPGDHVIFARLDRSFRDLADLVGLQQLWRSRGIVVHFADMAADLSSPSGALVAGTMEAIAQWQSRSYSERNKEIAARSRKFHRPLNGQKRLGYRLYRGQWVPDDQERAVMAEVVRLRDTERLSWEKISDSIEDRLCEYEGRKFKKSAFFVRKWSRYRCRRAYDAYKQILADDEASRGGKASA